MNILRNFKHNVGELWKVSLLHPITV